MKVGAVMPHYNQWEFAQEAIDSVIGQVDDFVFVDDCSDRVGPIDDLVFPEYASFKMMPENTGTANAINAGIEKVEGDWLTWVSADNTYRSNWMETLKAHVEENTGVVYSAYRWYKPGGHDFVVSEGYKPLKLINSPRNCFFGPSFIIRRDVWEEAGGHRGRISHDYDHWLRVEEVCWKHGLEIVHVPDVLCDYLAHDKRVTVTRKSEFDAMEWQQEAMKRRAEMPYAP